MIKPSRRPATHALYETITRLYLKPGLGQHNLRRLSVPIVQAFLNGKLAEGQSNRNVHMMRQVLSAALTRAVREELITRNVAHLIELPPWEPGDVAHGPPRRRWLSSAPPGPTRSTPRSSC